MRSHWSNSPLCTYSWAEFDHQPREAATSRPEYIWNIKLIKFNNLDLVKTQMYERQRSTLAFDGTLVSKQETTLAAVS